MPCLWSAWSTNLTFLMDFSSRRREILCSVICIIMCQLGPVLVTEIQISIIAGGLNMVHRTAARGGGNGQARDLRDPYRFAILPPLPRSVSFCRPRSSESPVYAAVSNGSQAQHRRSTQNYQSQFAADANLLLTEQIIGTVAMRDTEVFTAANTRIFVFRVIRHVTVVQKVVRII
jgi:hypothetical protein